MTEEFFSIENEIRSKKYFLDFYKNITKHILSLSVPMSYEVWDSLNKSLNKIEQIEEELNKIERALDRIEQIKRELEIK